MSAPRSHKGAFGVPRSLRSIALSVGDLPLFLCIVSLLSVSYPLSSSLHGYLLGLDRYRKADSDSIFLNNNQTEALLSPLDRPQDGNDSTIATEPHSNSDAPTSPADDTEASNEGITARGNVNISDSSSVASALRHSASSQPEPSAEVDSRSCNIYNGKWIFDPAGPLYTNNTCPVITPTQNCQGNGRPDKDYENWRWKPEGCDLARFDARKFLELMRGKTLAFVGDSVARNHMESMLCILWQVEAPKNRGNKRMQRWNFRSTNTTIVRIWSAWLVHKTSEPFPSVPDNVVKVHLDLPDEDFMEHLPTFDVLVLSSGHWFSKQSAYILNSTIVGGQLWWPKEARQMQINNIDAFGISVETCLTAIASHPKFRGLAILRSFLPDHYEGGAWNIGGSCTGKVKPVPVVVRNKFTDAMHDKQVSGFEHVVKKAATGSKFRLMDVTEILGYRADGHPGPYRSSDPNKVTRRGPNGKPPPQDCLHWCMPGPIDTLNEIFLEVIRREFDDK